MDGQFLPELGFKEQAAMHFVLPCSWTKGDALGWIFSKVIFWFVITPSLPLRQKESKGTEEAPLCTNAIGPVARQPGMQ